MSTSKFRGLVLYHKSAHKFLRLQELAFTLCHSYARATRSVSIPAPVYYADVRYRIIRTHLCSLFNRSSVREAHSTSIPLWATTLRHIPATRISLTSNAGGRTSKTGTPSWPWRCTSCDFEMRTLFSIWAFSWLTYGFLNCTCSTQYCRTCRNLNWWSLCFDIAKDFFRLGWTRFDTDLVSATLIGCLFQVSTTNASDLGAQAKSCWFKHSCTS